MLNAMQALSYKAALDRIAENTSLSDVEKKVRRRTILSIAMKEDEELYRTLCGYIRAQ